ncbi:ribosome maturation factor RimP [Oscillospiraceae bacterium LTW-04]|nr:ribosome maturation factor RimP [Oscillospiraceae bacterium MB24-C1]
MAKAKQNTAQTAEKLAQPVLLQMGLRLWDVRFEKEGGAWFLRYFIDKDGGVDINDCEQFSRFIDPILDAADPIDGSYSLEVSSPGIERELTKPWHFEENIGRPVTARLIRARNGLREIAGTLVSYHEGTAVIRETESETEQTVAKGEAAYIRLQDDFDYSKGAGQ